MRFTRQALFLMIVGAIASHAAAQDKKTTSHRLEARVDPRVELMSLIFRLAGNNEYNQPASKSPYSDEVEAQFGKFRDHAVVKMAGKLRNDRGVSYDAVMKMAVHLADTKRVKLKIPLAPFPPLLDRRWPPDDTPKFLRNARAFVKDSGFNEFFEQHRELYDAAGQRLTEKLNERDYVGWFKKFFGERSGAEFYVIVGMLNGPCNYSSGILYPNGREEIVPVIGAGKFDRDGIPVFGDGNVSTIVHEFCHSYTNVFVDQYAEQLQPAGERIFKGCKAVMRRQAYGTWQTMLKESLVRASVVRYLRTADGKKAARQEIKENRDRGFTWIGELSEKLAEYESQRDCYPTFDAFMPQVIVFFNDYAKEHGGKGGKAPKVVRMIPPNGATDVDPDLREIQVFFDRPMRDRSWAVVGGGPHFPEKAGESSYDAERTVFTMPVRLKPDWSYEFWLNRGRFTAFQSEDGVMLESVEVRFKTRKE